jgi:ribosome-associated toxin RatA of RatAB toxin-antitoxin module
MRQLLLDAVIRSTPAETVFDNILQFDRYPDLAPHVQSTVVHESEPGTGRSSWELHFRSGLLRWTERERFLRSELRLEFEQCDGDFDEFAGFWSLTQVGTDTAVHFSAGFDFGIPSMEGILDPIAERVIKETVAWVLVGMFPDVHLDEQFDLHPVRTS